MTTAQAIARIKTLQAERATLNQSYLNAREPLTGTGSYGQASQRDIDAAEDAQMILKHWDDDNGAELKQLLAAHGKRLGPEILDQRM